MIQKHDDGYEWLENYGKGRLQRRLNYQLKRRGLAWGLGIAMGIMLGFVLLPWLYSLGGG
jgi:hypothetical protein